MVIRERSFTNEARGCCIVDWSSSAGRARAEAMTLRYELQLAVRRVPASADAPTAATSSDASAAPSASASAASAATGSETAAPADGMSSSSGNAFATIYKGIEPRVRLLGLEPLGAVFTVRVRALRLALCPESFAGTPELAGPNTDVELALPLGVSGSSLPASFCSSPHMPSFRIRVTRAIAAPSAASASESLSSTMSSVGWSIEASPVDLSAERASADSQSIATHSSPAPAVATSAAVHPIAEQHVAARVPRAAPHSALGSNLTTSCATQQTITSAPSAVAVTRPVSAGARSEGRAHQSRKMRPLRAMQEYFLDALCRLFGLNVEVESDVQVPTLPLPSGRSSAAAQTATSITLASRSSAQAHAHEQHMTLAAATTASSAAAARSSRLAAVAESFALDRQQRRLLLLVSALTALFALLLSVLLTSFVEF